MAGKTLEQLEARVRELLQDSDDSDEGPATPIRTTRARPPPPITLAATLPTEIQTFKSPIANGSVTRNLMLSRSE